MRVCFVECLNDLMDHLLLADAGGLTAFQADRGLGDDLLAAFTTTDEAERAIRQGVMIALPGIENLPYTVVLSVDHPSVFGPDDGVQHRVGGHVLRVVSGNVCLLTLPLLRSWPTRWEAVRDHRPAVDLPSGWYVVEVVAGESLRSTGWEPTIEFLLRRVDAQPEHAADVDHRYGIRCRAY